MKIIVVVSQSGGSLERRDFEERLVAQVADGGRWNRSHRGAANGRVGTETTGLLCLEGIKGDMVFVSWLDAPAAHQGLAERGVFGRFGRTTQNPIAPDESSLPVAQGEPLAPGVYDAMQRRIFCLDLSGYSAVDEISNEIERIADESSVKTVQLLDMGNNVVDLSSSSTPTAAAGSTQPENVADVGSPADVAGANAGPAGTSKAIERRPHLRDELMEEVELTEDEASLEQLVDQFDELDI